MVGGNIKRIVTGGGPINPDVIKFFRVVLSCKLVDGFGHTEGGRVFNSDALDTEFGHVGGVYPAFEFRLVDIPDLNYTSQDVIDGISIPRGELCTRNVFPRAQLFDGYFLQPELTQEVFDEDGWFHTGDVVALLPNYAIKVIDRKKNIFKLSQCEYIAPDKLEYEYSKIDIVKQIFIYGDASQNYIVAIIVPEQREIERWASENNISIEYVYESQELIDYMTNQIQEKKIENGFNSLEVPKKFCFTDEEMTISNNTLTPTLKCKRNNAKLKYLDLIREMYDGTKLQGE